MDKVSLKLPLSFSELLEVVSCGLYAKVFGKEFLELY